MSDEWDAWDQRLWAARSLTFALPRETECLQLHDHARGTGFRVVLPTGTQVEYLETRYDAMRLDQCWHTMRVVSGPSAGSLVRLTDCAGPGPLAWE